MGVIDCGVKRNGCNRLLWNGMGVIDCGVERNGCNRTWRGTELV
jgi:methenyltetrahydromethanopterin cyclohydrolase